MEQRPAGGTVRRRGRRASVLSLSPFVRVEDGRLLGSSGGSGGLEIAITDPV
jgi:hypothetical protein